MKEQCPMCQTNYSPPDLRHCPKCGWCLRERQLQDEIDRLHGEVENGKSFVFNITPRRTVDDATGSLDEQIELLRLRHLTEVERLQEKCFNDTMAAKKSGYEEGRAEVERLQNELTQLRAERSGAINIARVICHDNDWWNGWPDTLHLADVIEKRIYNLCLDWRRAAEAAEGGESDEPE